jgi:A/G-specific adenine glycosylase
MASTRYQLPTSQRPKQTRQARKPRSAFPKAVAADFEAADLAAKIAGWYLENKRPLPWRLNRDPYRIWISEVMLQQTTVTAVIPFYERFMTAFPTLQDLSDGPIAKVLELWTGLGYYSRARNLHKAALALHANGWPKTYIELLEKPGFGPYTARAVASLAFGESVGVLDGNVIRVLSRLTAEPVEHWTTAGRKRLQGLSDQLAQAADPAVVNQALMELGATICTPRSPQCLLCPWFKFCEGRQQDKLEELPLKKARKAIETWVWVPYIFLKGKKVALVKNEYAPFLKGQWLFPGRAERRTEKPKQFDLRHGITHHDIYVQVSKGKTPIPKGVEWVTIQEITNWNPSILLQKTLARKKH